MDTTSFQIRNTYCKIKGNQGRVSCQKIPASAASGNKILAETHAKATLTKMQGQGFEKINLSNKLCIYSDERRGSHLHFRKTR